MQSIVNVNFFPLATWVFSKGFKQIDFMYAVILTQNSTQLEVA